MTGGLVVLKILVKNLVNVSVTWLPIHCHLLHITTQAHTLPAMATPEVEVREVATLVIKGPWVGCDLMECLIGTIEGSEELVVTLPGCRSRMMSDVEALTDMLSCITRDHFDDTGDEVETCDAHIQCGEQITLHRTELLPWSKYF